MKKILIALIVLVYSQAIMAGQEKINQTIGSITGDIFINAEGVVTAVNLNQFSEGKMKDLLVGAIKKWQFYPMQIDGKNVDVETKFNFDLIITNDKENREIESIEFQSIYIAPAKNELDIQKFNIKQENHNKDLSKLRTPNYPQRALSMNVQARVDIVVKIMPDGKVEKADLYKCALMNVNSYIQNKIQMKQMCRDFSVSAINAIENWQFSQLILRTNQCANGCISTINIKYITNDVTWRSYLLVDTPPVLWVETEQVLSDISIENSKLVRLKDDPTGKPIDMGS